MQGLFAIVAATVKFAASGRGAGSLPKIGLLLLIAAASLLGPSQALAAKVADVVAQVDGGNFALAEKKIAKALGEPGLVGDDRRALEFERERMRRIRLDFPLTRNEVETRLRKSIPDLRADEFDAWDKANLLEHLVDRKSVV